MLGGRDHEFIWGHIWVKMYMRHPRGDTQLIVQRFPKLYVYHLRDFRKCPHPSLSPPTLTTKPHKPSCLGVGPGLLVGPQSQG